jgi:hypothetical protein
MADRVTIFEAELEALILWDRLYCENPAPDQIEKDACKTRMFRRVQLIAELHKAASLKMTGSFGFRTTPSQRTAF